MDVAPNTPSRLYAYLAAFATIYFVTALLSYVKLRRFPGPLCATISNLPHSRAMLDGRCHLFYAEANKKYGPIARVAPNIVVTSSAQVWAHTNNTPGYKRSDWYYNAVRIEHRRDNVFSQTDNSKHEQRRKQMAPGYSGRENLDLEPSIDDCVQQFVNLMRTKYVSTTEEAIPVDISRKVQYFTLDVISKVGLGKSFGMLQADEDVDNYLQSSEEGLFIGNVALALGFSWLTHLPGVGRFIAPSPADSNGFGKMMATCFRYVDERVANPTDKRSDMLASFIRHGLAGHELRTEALEQIIAGSDTTATGIRVTLLHIMANSRVYRKLQAEVDEAVRNEDAPTGVGGVISFAQAKKLPYLQAVIREALRLDPPVANIFSRDVPPGGDTVQVNDEKFYLPEGTSIGYSAFAMHHDPEIFGHDASAFRPERWFESDPEKLRNMLFTNELVFGYGKFRCLGQNIAQMELSKLLFEICRNFDFAIVNPSNPWNIRNCLGLFQISDMWVQVTGRACVDL